MLVCVLAWALYEVVMFKSSIQSMLEPFGDLPVRSKSYEPFGYFVSTLVPKLVSIVTIVLSPFSTVVTFSHKPSLDVAE